MTGGSPIDDNCGLAPDLKRQLQSILLVHRKTVLPDVHLAGRGSLIDKFARCYQAQYSANPPSKQGSFRAVYAA